MPKDRLIVLIAPNVSEQMGGEAIKALQIFQQLSKINRHTYQITHVRNRDELSTRLKLTNVVYLEDTWMTTLVWRTRVFGWLLSPWFCRNAVKKAEQLAAEQGFTGDEVIIHQTEPNSPVMPRSISKRHINVFGPINGNIYYPAIFRDRETSSARLRRVLHMKIQAFNRIFCRGVTRSDLVLVAGGERTRRSLEVAGCGADILFETVDCGIKDEMLNRPRVLHRGANLRFVHFGRLVFHKCTFLIIESMVKTKQPICLDIVGSGPELENCKQLAQSLGLSERVRFLGWYTSHSDLVDSFNTYRGVVLPTIEDANGIVVQEAMALGLPPVCLDWGGPQLLIEHGVSGYLIEPKSREHITTQMADYLDTLAVDGELAESMSASGRERAESWRWSAVAQQWLDQYPSSRRRAMRALTAAST